MSSPEKTPQDSTASPKTGEKLTRAQLYRMKLLEACRKEVARRKAEKDSKKAE